MQLKNVNSCCMINSAFHFTSKTGVRVDSFTFVSLTLVSSPVVKCVNLLLEGQNTFNTRI